MFHYIQNIYDDEIRDGWIVTSQTKKIWNSLLIICEEVERICSKYNITYWGAFGTLLGVKQYNGFIPWDNDVDLNMFRPDYNRFCKVLKKELNNKYFDIVLYNPFFIKISYRNATYIGCNKNFFKNDCNNIVLDITPLDIAYDDTVEQSLFMVNKLFELRCYAIKSKHYSDDQILEANALCEQIFDKSNYVNEIKRLYKEKGHKKSLYSNTIHLPFELFNMPCPIGYKEICYHYYGDFKKQIDDHHCNLNYIFVDLPSDYCKEHIDFSLYIK